jgi:hypothetical protein
MVITSLIILLGLAFICHMVAIPGRVIVIYHYKTNIESMKPCLDLINKLKPVSYNWKKLPNENVNYGFIAQDVEQLSDTRIG